MSSFIATDRSANFMRDQFTRDIQFIRWIWVNFLSENIYNCYINVLSYLMLFKRRIFANFIMYLDVIVNRTKRGQTEWVERLDYLFVMHECTFHVYSSHLRIQCIVMSMCQSMNIDQSYYITGVNKFLKVEHSGFLSK
jgi:hypothetical protein